jgi:hypothetical protein
MREDQTIAELKISILVIEQPAKGDIYEYKPTLNYLYRYADMCSAKTHHSIYM